MHEVERHIEYYRPRMGSLQFGIEDATAAGVINGRGLVAFCTDETERKRFDGIVKSIKPFNPVHHGSKPNDLVTDQSVSMTIGVSPVTNKNVDNMTLKLTDGETGDFEVDFVNGEWNEAISDADSGQQQAEIYFIYDRAFGDLNGDGVTDAAVITEFSTDGTGKLFSLCTVIASLGQPKSSNAIYLCDRIQIKSLKIKSGKIIVSAIIQGSNEGLCCPTQKASITYGIKGEKLVKFSR
jgi:hypothetical protein